MGSNKSGRVAMAVILVATLVTGAVIATSIREFFTNNELANQ